MANVFLKEPGWKVRGVSRTPAKAKDWVTKGVEVVQGDLDDKASLIKAFQGASAIFGVTDFWGPMSNPAIHAKVAKGQAINEYVYHYEQQQGRNIAEAAAAIPTLERFIMSSLCDAKYWTKGRLAHIYHFDGKAHVVSYIKEKFPDLAAKMSVVQLAAYMTNFGTFGQPTKVIIAKVERGCLLIDAQLPDGSWQLSFVGKGDTLVPQVYTQRDTGNFVKALLQVPPGKNLLGAGAHHSWKETMKIWCDCQKVPYGGYKEANTDDFVKTFPMGPDIGLEFAEMLLLMDDPGYDGGDPSVILPKDVSSPSTMDLQHC